LMVWKVESRSLTDTSRKFPAHEGGENHTGHISDGGYPCFHQPGVCHITMPALTLVLTRRPVAGRSGSASTGRIIVSSSLAMAARTRRRPSTLHNRLRPTRFYSACTSSPLPRNISWPPPVGLGKRAPLRRWERPGHPIVTGALRDTRRWEQDHDVRQVPLTLTAPWFWSPRTLHPARV
jgi:hypothetical protein